MYTAILLSPGSCDIVRSLAIPPRAEDADLYGLKVTIHGHDYHCLAPSEEEMLFYDFLYSQSGALTGMELRIHEEHVLQRFRAETESWKYVTWDVFPRIWLGAERSGDPKPSTVELFADVWLCRADPHRWAVVVDLDGGCTRMIDLGILRAPDGPDS